jgi:polyhydroxyalkanoate synthesis regulator phasin
LGLHLEAVGEELRLWDPKAQKYLLTPDEKLAKAQRQLLETLDDAKKQRDNDHAEIDRLRHEVEALKQQAKKGNVQP